MPDPPGRTASLSSTGRRVGAPCRSAALSAAPRTGCRVSGSNTAAVPCGSGGAGAGRSARRRAVTGPARRRAGRPADRRAGRRAEWRAVRSVRCRAAGVPGRPVRAETLLARLLVRSSSGSPAVAGPGPEAYADGIRARTVLAWQSTFRYGPDRGSVQPPPKRIGPGPGLRPSAAARPGHGTDAGPPAGPRSPTVSLPGPLPVPSRHLARRPGRRRRPCRRCRARPNGGCGGAR
jgi:hypothetical protein